MNKLLIAGFIFTSMLVASCGNNSSVGDKEIAAKKTKLGKLKDEKTRLEKEIQDLQKEIAKLDPAFVAVAPKLVEVLPVSLKPFEHYIDLQGRVDADNISYITPRGGPAQVKELYISKGDIVKKGQLLMKLDDAVQLRQLESLKTQLAYAEDIFKRQSNLWSQGIGTEVQLKTAENNVNSLKDQINTLKEAWQMTNVKSEVNGYVEQLNLRVGEIFSGFAGTQPQVMIVNSQTLKVVTDIPENYLGKVKKGTPVDITLPDVGLNMQSSISLMSQTIGINSRSVISEAKIPFRPEVHVNQVAQVKILDYKNSNAIVIPLITLQTDEKGKYVYVMVDEGGKKVARKKPVVVGEIYGEEIEVMSGLSEGDQLITQGYQGIYEGQTVTTDVVN